jgi:hypothetical protein
MEATKETNETTTVAADPILFGESEFVGRLKALFVEQMKHLPDVWQKMSKDQQDDSLDAVEKALNEIVIDMVEFVASEDRPTLAAMLDKVVVKDGIQGTITMAKHDPARHDLFDAQGQEVLIVVAGAEGYVRGGEKVQGEEDQRNLGL